MVKRLSVDARKLVLTSAASPRIQRRTNVARIFHSQACLRLVTALAVETSEEWETGRRYPDMELLEEILGKLATMYAGGELGEGEYARPVRSSSRSSRRRRRGWRRLPGELRIWCGETFSKTLGGIWDK